MTDTRPRFTGHDIMALGIPAGPHMGAMIARANALGRLDRADLQDLLPPPTLPLRESGDFAMLAEATSADEAANLADVAATMRELMRTPVLRALAEDLGSTDLGYLHMRLDWGLDGFIPGGSNWWLAISSPHSGTPFDLATTLASALAVIGVCLVAARALPRCVALLSGAGAMSLTTYSLHATALSERAWPPEETRSFWIHLAFFGGVGAVFRLAGLKGPLEWVVSQISTRATAAARRFTPQT